MDAGVVLADCMIPFLTDSTENVTADRMAEFRKTALKETETCTLIKKRCDSFSRKDPL